MKKCVNVTKVELDLPTFIQICESITQKSPENEF